METTTFEWDGTTWELAYAARRIDMMEAALKRSVIEVLSRTPTLAEARSLIAYGMREVGTSAWAAPGRAMGIAGDYVAERGLSSAMEMVSSAILRDCGFLFR